MNNSAANTETAAAADAAPITSAATTLAVQAVVKAMVTDMTTKADAVLVAVQNHLKVESNQGADQFKCLLEAIKAAAKEASDENVIPATIKQTCSVFAAVYKGDKGLKTIQDAAKMYTLRKAYNAITEAAKAEKEAKAKSAKADKGEADADTSKVVVMSEAITKLLASQTLINSDGSRVLQNELTVQIEALVETFNSRLGIELTDAKRKQDATVAAMKTEAETKTIKAKKVGPTKPKGKGKQRNASAKSATAGMMSLSNLLGGRKSDTATCAN